MVCKKQGDLPTDEAVTIFQQDMPKLGSMSKDTKRLWKY
jgi:hypothetical protein